MSCIALALLAACGQGDTERVPGETPGETHSGLSSVLDEVGRIDMVTHAEGVILTDAVLERMVQGAHQEQEESLVTALQTKAPANRVLKPTAKGFALTSREFARLYGPGVFNMNALANTVVGVKSNLYHIVSNRFRATGSGHLVYVRLMFPQGPGYSKGHGGTIRLRLYPDDRSAAHLPNLRQTMATAVFKPRLAMDVKGENKKGGIFQEIRFKSTQPVEAGKLYHLLLDNIDPSPASNFISTDNIVTTEGNGRPARWLNTWDWSVLMATRPTAASPRNHWVNLTEKGSSANFFSPIMEVGLSSGHVQGNADMQTGAVDPDRVYTATAAKPVRERFTPSKDKRVSGLSVATAASVGGALQWRIMDGNTPLVSGVLRQPQANYKPLKMNTGLMVANMVWYDVALPKDVVLKAGKSYDVEFRPLGASQWKFAAHHNGMNYGFKWPAAFTESQAQHLHQGRWIGTSYWRYDVNASGANWPVVLHLAP
ncbi:MAG: hypothetical protein Q4D91_01910 [Lautropia sp.]|nr:hypothetical protein [Lautropia sp.]